MPYLPISHTADIGFKVWAPTLAGLFAEAGRAFVDCLVDAGDKPAPTQRLEIKLEAETVEELLVQWLEELLFIFETKGILALKFEAKQCEPVRLHMVVHGVEWDEKKQPLKTQIKAVTFHELAVQKTKKGFATQIILDV